jgi:hypothetical protein
LREGTPSRDDLEELRDPLDAAEHDVEDLRATGAERAHVMAAVRGGGLRLVAHPQHRGRRQPRA